MSEIVDLTNVDLGVENLGEMWEDFIARCTPAHATLFNESYNLIALSFPDSFIDSTLTHLFIDEGLETSELMSHVRLLLINSIIDALQIMGVIIDKDYLEMNSLEELKNVLDTVYLFDGLTDLIGLVDVLNNEELDCKERFIQVVRMTQPQYDMSNMEYYITDVSPNVIRGLLIGLNIIDEDDTEHVDHTLKTRIRDNKLFLAGTLAGQHIQNGGGVGQVLDAYMRLFMSDLADMLVKDKLAYMTNILGIMLISSLSDNEISGQFNALIEDQCDQVDELFKATAIMNKVKLNAQA